MISQTWAVALAQWGWAILGCLLLLRLLITNQIGEMFRFMKRIVSCAIAIFAVKIVFLPSSCFAQVGKAHSASVELRKVSDDPWAEPKVIEVTEQATSNSSQTYVVLGGDNLWNIAQRFSNSKELVGIYWIKLIEENKNNLKSGNVNLIYPGEQIYIPAQINYDH